jgi:hypothetical protein
MFVHAFERELKLLLFLQLHLHFTENVHKVVYARSRFMLY